MQRSVGATRGRWRCKRSRRRELLLSVHRRSEASNRILLMVAQRTQEIGIRMALGAERRTVQAIVLRETLVLAVAGVGVGVGGALITTRTIASLLFGVTPHDP